MSRVFISYSSKDRSFVLELAQNLKNAGHEIWLDIWEITGRKPYWAEIQTGIESCSHFIFAISPDSIDPDGGANIELYHAAGLKPGHRPVIVPVMIRETPYESLPILISPGRLQIHDFTTEPYDTALKSVLRALDPANPAVKASAAVIPTLSTHAPSSSDISQVSSQPASNIWTNQPNPTMTVAATAPRRISVRALSVLSGVVAIIFVGLIISKLYSAGIGSGSMTTTSIALVATTVASETPLLTETAVKAISTATPPPTRTLIPTPIPTITSNGHWKPYIQTQTFDDYHDVEMVLVPPGCFVMGDSNFTDATPNKQCFEMGFWLDKYPVTNAQFAEFNGKAHSASNWTDANRPRETITWVEARAFCTARGAGIRLPTEKEWEYAARGPDDLPYPWGNAFNTYDSVSKDISGGQTANVVNSNGQPSRPDGVSWVGAYDMVGNVWEWTSSIHQSYPYKADDGRENPDDTSSPRVLRGGSFGYTSEFLRTAYRNYFLPPNSVGKDIGFRCARDF